MSDLKTQFRLHLPLQHLTFWSCTDLESILLLKQQAHCWAAPEVACVSCSFHLTAWIRDHCLKSAAIPVQQPSLFPFFPWVWPIFHLISSATFVLPTELFQLPRFLLPLTLKIVCASYIFWGELNGMWFHIEKCICYCCSYPSWWGCSTGGIHSRFGLLENLALTLLGYYLLYTCQS